jgi:hypothetical protein
MQASTSGSNVRYYPTWKQSPLTERCLYLGYESLRLLIAYQYEVFRPPTCSVLPPHCIKDVYIPQGSTRYLWTVPIQTPWIRALLENLTVPQLIKKFHAICVTKRFITILTRARNWPLTWVSSSQSIPIKHFKQSYTNAISSYSSCSTSNIGLSSVAAPQIWHNHLFRMRPGLLLI